MPIYTWLLPAAPSTDIGASGRPVASSTFDLQGLLDLAFDPLTKDLVDAADGGLVETTDSRTAVIFQMEATYKAWWGDFTQGSQLRDLLIGRKSNGEEVGATPQMIVDEVKRCLQPLVDEGVIADLSAGIDIDEVGRPAIQLLYRDPSSGTMIDLSYVPFNA